MNRPNRFSLVWPGRLILPLLSLMLCQSVSPALAEDPLVSITTQAVVERQVATPEGRLTLQRVPVDKALPGDMVIFVNTITNNSDAAAENLAVKNPIPPDMLFVSGSATGEKAIITFSVNGGASFDRPEKLMVAGTDGKPRLATPADYTDIRWLFSTPLPAKSTEQVEFQAQVK